MDKYLYFFTGKFGIYKQLKFRLRYYQLQRRPLWLQPKPERLILLASRNSLNYRGPSPFLPVR